MATEKNVLKEMMKLQVYSYRNLACNRSPKTVLEFSMGLRNEINTFTVKGLYLF